MSMFRSASSSILEIFFPSVLFGLSDKQQNGDSNKILHNPET